MRKLALSKRDLKLKKTCSVSPYETVAASLEANARSEQTLKKNFGQIFGTHFGSDRGFWASLSMILARLRAGRSCPVLSTEAGPFLALSRLGNLNSRQNLDLA